MMNHNIDDIAERNFQAAIKMACWAWAFGVALGFNIGWFLARWLA